MIPATTSSGVIEGAQQVQRKDAGFREQIATERPGRRREAVKECDDDRREDE